MGGVSEEPFGTGVVGETFGRIIGEQFFVLKDGDRFWYETTNKNVGFTKGIIILLIIFFSNFESQNWVNTGYMYILMLYQNI